MIAVFAGRKFRLTSPFGDRVLNGKKEFHKGYDLVGVDSKVVIAAAGGTVIRSRMITDKSNRTWEFGNYVCIYGDDGRYYYYCHLASRAVSCGQRVQAGDKLGVMGATGYAFGAHLHFEIRDAEGTSICPEAIVGIPNAEGSYELPNELEADIAYLVSVGVINTPEYWEGTAPTVRYLPQLLHKIVSRMKGERP